MAGRHPSGRSSRPGSDALHPGQHGSMREHAGPVGRAELRPAGSQGDAAACRDRRSAGAAGDAGGAASATRAGAGLRAAARSDRRHHVRARRGVAGVDPAGPHDLGLLRVRHPVQSGSGVPVLRLASAVAGGTADAGRRRLPDAGGRLYRPAAVRASSAGRPGGRGLAPRRACIAGARGAAPRRRPGKSWEAPSAIAPRP